MAMGIQNHQNEAVTETYNTFVQSFAQVRRSIYAFIFVLVGNAADADDLFQEVCVVLWRRFDQFTPGTNFLAWAKQIARNLVMDYRKRRSRRVVTALDDKMLDLLATRFDRIQDQVEDRMEALKQCLNRLEDKDRHLLRETYEEGAPVKRIAKKAQISVQGIYKRLGNAHGALLRCVQRTLENRGGTSMTYREARELDAAMMCLLKGRITPEERDDLRTQMMEDLEVLNHCLDLLIVSAGLELIHQDVKKQARPSEGRLQKGLQSLRILIPTRRTTLTLVKIAAAIALVGGAAVWIIQGTGRQPSSAGLAEVIGDLAVKWANTPRPVVAGSHMGRGPWNLAEGIAEFRMASGAEVIVRGPCQFSLEGENQVALTLGSLTARVPDKARGFKVSTQKVDIVDMGTEFGVIAEADGRVEAHVFSGEVVVVPDREATSPSTVRLGTGMAAAVSTTGQVAKAPAAEERFVREMPSKLTQASPGRQLDLADVVGGGNGFGSGTLGRGLSPDDGQTVHAAIPALSRARRSGYIILFGRYIDGVFVPNGQAGANAVSSTGLVFAGCPDTDGTFAGGIINGGRLATSQGQPGTLASLRGKYYGTDAAPALRIHPNAGVTFNLEGIRRDTPGAVLRSFRGLAGISETAPARPASATEFWVLIDGQVRFHHRVEPGDFKSASIDVAIDAKAQYLTVVATSAASTENCWAIIAEPFLEFGPTD
jgi:RNA polymerase sigma-70 factor